MRKWLMMMSAVALAVLAGCTHNSKLRSKAWSVARARAQSDVFWDKNPIIGNETDPESRVEELSQGVYRVTSTRIAKNGYNVPVHGFWTCVVMYDGSDWFVLSYDSRQVDGEGLPSLLEIRPENGSSVVSLTDDDEWLDYESLQANPGQSLPNGRTFDREALIRSGRMFDIPAGTQVKPLKRSGLSEWFVQIATGPLTGRNGWIHDSDCIQIEPRPDH